MAHAKSKLREDMLHSMLINRQYTKRTQSFVSNACLEAVIFFAFSRQYWLPLCIDDRATKFIMIFRILPFLEKGLAWFRFSLSNVAWRGKLVFLNQKCTKMIWCHTSLAASEIEIMPRKNVWFCMMFLGGRTFCKFRMILSTSSRFSIVRRNQ